MRLLYVFSAILAISLADHSVDHKVYDDSEAVESVETMELKKVARDLSSSASTYSNFQQPNHNQLWTQTQNYVPNSPSLPPTNYVPPQTWYPPQNQVPQNPIPQNPIPQNPVNNYVPSAPVTPAPVQSDYYYPQNNYWTTHNYPVTTTTTPVPVIKNEQTYGDNGSYKYEYQIGDGTHVGEEGYYTDPKATDESLVKKGWYSYMGADGKTYTVTYWADKTGFHAYGDHLPTPPTPHPAIQAAIAQNAKEEAAKAEAEKNKPQTVYYPTQTPQPVYYPYPTQAPVYYPPQQTYYPQQGYGK